MRRGARDEQLVPITAPRVPELVAAVEEQLGGDTLETLKIMIQGKRLKDISDLPLDLAV